MLIKIQAFLQRFNPHSKVFIVAVFSLFFLILILITLQFRVGQSEQNNTSQNTPSPAQKVLVPGKDYVEGQINAKFSDGMTDDQINVVLSEYNSRIKSTISGINVKVVEVPVGQEKAISEQLIERGVVKYAELDVIGHTQIVFNDTDFTKQYGLLNTGQNIKGTAGIADNDVDADMAWDVTRGEGVKVAVLDTGIDPNHPEFSGKIVLQKFFTTASIDDKFGHGTHVAGTVTANTNNSQGISGTCPNCQLIIGKIMDDNGSGTASNFASGMSWAADNGSKVINASIVYNQNVQTIADSVAYAWGKGAVIVAAAGNCGGSGYANNNCSFQNQTLYPAAYPNVVSVAALDNKGHKASYSNHGSTVDVAAPGTNVFSTFPTHSYTIQNLQNTALSYDYTSGTSMASPMVAGVAGLIWSSQYGTSNQAVVDRLLNTADPIEGTGTLWQKGRVNAAAAVASGSATVTPTGTIAPTGGVTPSTPVPTFVCGGSPDSVCNSPTPGGSPTNTPVPTISGVQPTLDPNITPSVTPGPVDDCLDVKRSTPERIMEWVKGFWNKVINFILFRSNNPQDTTPPPQPCIIR